MIFEPSRVIDEARCAGGGGIAAARAKKASIIDAEDVEGGTVPKGVDVGSSNSIPCWWSTQVPHPSGQSPRSFAACCSPRCSVHPGHVQSKPHVQPVPARETIAPSGGMAGKLGGGIVGEMADDAGIDRIGGSAGPLRSLSIGDGDGLLRREWRRRLDGGEPDPLG